MCCATDGHFAADRLQALRQMRWLLLLTCIGCTPACNRSTNSPPAPTATASLTGPTPSATGPKAPAPSAVKPTKPERCIVATRDQPPPTQVPAANCPADPTGPLDLPRVSLAFIDAPGAPVVEVEHATNNQERQRGLMYRQKLAAHDGMLFSWENERPRSFWMKNTCLPLDMLFIAADGTIVGILEQVPPMNLASRRIPCPAMHVLEMNAGWARAAGVKAGQTLKVQP